MTVHSHKDNGVRPSGRQLAELVTILKAAHDADIRHDDIKPENVYMYESKSGNECNIMLNDWGCSTKLNGGAVGGTKGFSEPATETLNPRVRDLRALLRCAWSIVFGEAPESFPPRETIWERVWNEVGNPEASDSLSHDTYEIVFTFLACLK